jgi:hypothetical protein
MNTYTLADPDGAVSVTGDVIGRATTEKPGKPRWFEITLYRLHADSAIEHGGSYALHTVGRSTVADESDRFRVRFTDSPFEIIEFLTDHRAAPPRLTYAATRALAQAADRDDEVRRAYLAAVA